MLAYLIFDRSSFDQELTDSDLSFHRHYAYATTIWIVAYHLEITAFLGY